MKKSSSNRHKGRPKGILLLAFLLFAVVLGSLVFRKYQTAGHKPQPPAQSVPAGTVEATLFFASADGEGLVREGREVEVGESVEETVEAIVDELVSGPVGSAAPTLPANTRVLGVTLQGDVAQIDFGQELVDELPSGSSAETVAVYSIVDTVVANYPRIKAVQLLIEGAPAQTLKGHVELQTPLEPDFSLEQKGAQAQGPGTGAPAGAAPQPNAKAAKAAKSDKSDKSDKNPAKR